MAEDNFCPKIVNNQMSDVKISYRLHTPQTIIWALRQYCAVMKRKELLEHVLQ